MQNGKRLIAMAIGLFALVAVHYGCQTQDGTVPTEAERSLQTTTHITAAYVIGLIEDLIGDPTLERSAKSQFRNIVKARTEAEKIRRAESLFAWLTKHYAAGKWTDGVKTGELNLAIGQYVGLFPEVEDAGAATCLPGDLECLATPPSEEGTTTIPGDLITQPFTLLMFLADCAVISPNAVPPCYEIQTIPEGLTFGTSASGSLSLSQVELPVIAICAEFTQAFTPGVDVFLWHAHDGVVEPVPPEPVVICDEGPGELSSRWANPLLATFQPVLRMLSPQPLYAVGGKGVNIGGGISNFSVVGSCLPGCLPTTTTLSIVEGTTSFTSGQTITLRAVVDPEPDGGNVQFYATNPTQGSGIPIRQVVDGEATATFTCGSNRVPFGSHTAQLQYVGTVEFGGSLSNQIPYTCLET